MKESNPGPLFQRFVVRYKKTYVRLITINAPINLTAPWIIFSGGFFSLRGGLGPGARDFFEAHEIWSPKKSRVPGPIPPSN